MEGLTFLIKSVLRIYTKVKRKVRINDVKEDPSAAFADKFGEPKRVLDDGVQLSGTTSGMDKGPKQRSDSD